MFVSCSNSIHSKAFQIEAFRSGLSQSGLRPAVFSRHWFASRGFDFEVGFVGVTKSHFESTGLDPR